MDCDREKETPDSDFRSGSGPFQLRALYRVRRSCSDSGGPCRPYRADPDDLAIYGHPAGAAKNP